MVKTPKQNRIRNPNVTDKIVIVSKNLEALRNARSYLTAKGYSVMTATTIEEAIQLCQKSTPGLFICDLDFSPGSTEKLFAVLQVFFHEEKKN